MKKDKNKGKKSLAAVGAVVAAGLTSGIASATPTGLAMNTIAGITAAEVVAIDGNTYGFDELFAMQRPGNLQMNVAEPQHATKYGVPRPNPYEIITPEIALDTIQDGLIDFCAQLLDEDPYTKGVVFSLDSDLTREMGMSDAQLKELKAIIKDYYGVEVSYHRFYLVGQLNTLRLISEYILKLKSLWDK